MTIDEETKLGPDAWRTAALAAGEHLVDVGPPGYYEWDARQWWEWFSALPQHRPPTLEQWFGDVYHSWPEDVRRRLSLHDLKRMWDAQYGPTPGVFEESCARLRASACASSSAVAGARKLKERRMGFRGGHMARQQPGPRDVTRGPKAAGTYSRQVRQVTEESCVGGQPARVFTGTPCGDAGARAGADDSAPRAHHLNPIPRCKGWHLVGEPRCDWCSWGY